MLGFRVLAPRVPKAVANALSDELPTAAVSFVD